MHRFQAYYGYFIAAGSRRCFGKKRRNLKYNNQLPVQRERRGFEHGEIVKGNAVLSTEKPEQREARLVGRPIFC